MSDTWIYIFQYNQGFFFFFEDYFWKGLWIVLLGPRSLSTFTALTPSFSACAAVSSPALPLQGPDQVSRSTDEDMGDCECGLCPPSQVHFLSCPFVMRRFHKWIETLTADVVHPNPAPWHTVPGSSILRQSLIYSEAHVSSPLATKSPRLCSWPSPLPSHSSALWHKTKPLQMPQRILGNKSSLCVLTLMSNVIVLTICPDQFNWQDSRKMEAEDWIFQDIR